ncbi:MAG: PIN domain-containing protein [Desulfofustis sp. PB-SRB1]|jgi:predicted nucleic acid-binding protein|nr:PIN domain-containing protein [Desulfofustis sp. PB-SRB1]
MTDRRTGIDANLLIAAWSGRPPWFRTALTVLEDPARLLIVSDILWLEVMPKALYHANVEEASFYEAVFAKAHCQQITVELIETAKRLAQVYGLAAIDAIHIAVLLAADADEFVSGERGTKPMFRVSDLPIVSIWESAEG